MAWAAGIFLGTGEACLIQELVERDGRQIGEKEKQAAKLGAQLALQKVDMRTPCTGRGRGPRRVGAFIVSTAG